ncbi:MAG: hypothetical protein ACUVTL_06445 [Thermoproteota archaeon]
MSGKGLERRIEGLDPDIVAPSGLAACNIYLATRTLEIPKKVNRKVLIVVGDQHFIATARESLEIYPEIDVVGGVDARRAGSGIRG